MVRNEILRKNIYVDKQTLTGLSLNFEEADSRWKVASHMLKKALYAAIVVYCRLLLLSFSCQLSSLQLPVIIRFPNRYYSTTQNFGMLPLVEINHMT